MRQIYSWFCITFLLGYSCATNSEGYSGGGIQQLAMLHGTLQPSTSHPQPHKQKRQQRTEDLHTQIRVLERAGVDIDDPVGDSLSLQEKLERRKRRLVQRHETLSNLKSRVKGLEQQQIQAYLMDESDVLLSGNLDRKDFQNRLVKDVQRKLDTLGFDRRDIDGKAGNGTRAAIKAYEKSMGLIPFGQVTPQLVAHLNAQFPPQKTNIIRQVTPQANHQDSYLVADASTVLAEVDTEVNTQVNPSATRGALPRAVAAAETEEERIKTAQPSLGTEALVQEQYGAFNRRLTIEPAISYSHFDRAEINLSGFLALDAIFLGNIDLQEVNADVVNLDVTARYGLTDRLQIDVNLPFLYRSTTFESGGAGSADDPGGAADAPSSRTIDAGPELGDVNVGFSYELFKERTSWPGLVWNARFKSPTGSDPYGIKIIRPDPENQNLQIPQELPSGNGVWAVSSGFSMIKTVDPVVLFANFNYFHNFEGKFDDISTVEDQVTPGRVDLGNSFQYGLGMALALNERMSFSTSFSQRFVNKTSTQAQGGPRSEIIGSDANIATMNLGLTYALTDNLTWITNVGYGLTRDASDISIGMKFPYRF